MIAVMAQTMNTREAAEYLGVPVKRLRNWRSDGGGPRFTKPAGRAIYERADLDAWLRLHQRGAVRKKL